MTNTPYFSVIMPLYNHAQYVGEAVESVLGQSFGDFELIVCNDGSTDGSGGVVAAYDDPRITLVNKPNGGTATALNTCLLKSRGRYICWLSSDDIFAEHKLRTHYRHHEAHPESSLSIAPYGFMTMAGTDKRVGEQLIPSVESRLIQFLYGNYISGLSFCADRRLFELYGIFDDRYHCAQDVDRWLHFFRHQVPTYLSGEPQTFTRTGTGHEELAGPFGVLDVIKVMSNQLLRMGIAALVPATEPDGLTQDYVNNSLEHLFSPKNIFFRYQLQDHLASLVFHAGQKFQLRDAYAAAVREFAGRPRTPELALAADITSQIVAKLDAGSKETVIPLVEALVKLRNTVDSAQHREILHRYLVTGF